MSSLRSSLEDSLHSYISKESNQYKPYTQEGIDISRTKSHTSELSKIISGIRDDQEQDMDGYRDIARVEQVLLRRLTRNEDSAKGSTTNLTPEDDIQSNKGGEEHDNKSLAGPLSTHSADISGQVSNVEEEIEGPAMDSGFAWVVAVCAMFAVFSTWGANAGFGVFLAYYINSGKFEGASEYDYALIGGLIVFLAQFLAPICVLSYKIFGPKYVSYFGIIVQTAGYILASYSTKVWQLYLTQGVIIGFSFLFVFLPATLMLPTWFDKRRATAMGIAVAGSGLGGLFFALVVNKMIEVTGDQRWALRTSGIVALVVSLVACTIMKPRNYKPLPLKTTLTKEFIYSNAKVIFDVRVFMKSYSLCILAIWFGTVLLGYMVLIYSMSAYATLIGLTPSQGSILTAIMNAGQVVGRPLCGNLADRFGRVTFSSINCAIVTVFVLAFWINATSFGALCPFAVLVGMTMGIGSLMCQAIATDILDDLESLPAAWSGLNIVVLLFCIAAEVIALAIRKKDSPRPFLNPQILVGCCYFAGFIFLLVIREFLVRKTLRTRLKTAQTDVVELKTKAGYLKVCCEDELAEERVQRYEYLLGYSVKVYVIRMFYPIKV